MNDYDKKTMQELQDRARSEAKEFDHKLVPFAGWDVCKASCCAYCGALVTVRLFPESVIWKRPLEKCPGVEGDRKWDHATQ